MEKCTEFYDKMGEHGSDIPEPPPVPNENPAILDLVIKDIRERYPNRPYVRETLIKSINERNELGIKKYGTRLQAFNGRNALMDAYQESLDLVNYLRQAIFEDHELGLVRLYHVCLDNCAIICLMLERKEGTKND